MATPFLAADGLRVCLETALAGDTAPAVTCLRAGSETPLNFGTAQDECCAGLAWVRITAISPQTDPPASLEGADGNSCQTSLLYADLELGVARCAPWGTTAAGPDCDQWTALAFQLDNDARAMRQAVCCFESSDDVDEYGALYAVRAGRWEPLPAEGLCAGGTMQVRVYLACTDC